MRNFLGKEFRAVNAIVLQDMQTRFGRSYLSYAVAVAWPLTHALFLVGAYLLANRIAAVGDDPALFIFTGVIPYIVVFYPGRSMPMLYIQNKQVLGITAVKPINIIVAGIIVELVTAFIVSILICVVLILAGADIVPNNLEEATAAAGATLFLAVGLGVMNVAMVAIFGNFYIVFYIVTMVGMYMTAGVFIPTWLTPEPIRSWMAYNPLVNLVHWIRAAYYASYDPDQINKSMVIWTAAVMLLIGLLCERFLRNKFY